jgi:outer membrane protein TolC
MGHPLPARSLALLAALAAAGCSSAAHRRSADREVEEILAGKSRAVAAAKDGGMVYPVESPEGAGGGAAAGERRDPPVAVPAVLTLEGALGVAVKANREYVDRTESLYLSALALTSARFAFSPRLDATLSYVTRNATGSRPVDSAAGNVTASQILPTGGTVTASASSAGTLDRNADGSFDAGSTLRADLRQPLLKGAGYEASHEALTQAERNVVYAIRDFARYREEFLLDVTRRYYDILEQKTVVRNTEERYAASEYQVRRARALFDIGRQDKLEVLRAENELLSVENDLLNARDSLSLAVDQFKIFLGLPLTVAFEIADAEPAFRKVEVTLSSAVEAALANRFDLANSRERLEDAERGLRVARRNLLPDLSLEAGWSGVSAPTSHLLDQSYGSQAGSVGLFLEIPIQQTLERNAFRSAEIALDRERRQHQEFRDNVVVGVRETLRRLRQAAVGLEIQERKMAVEGKREEKARIDFEDGRIGNRDLLEAQKSVADAKNERIRRVFEYELARINLERTMGTLEVREDGTWGVLRAPAVAGPVAPPEEKP